MRKRFLPLILFLFLLPNGAIAEYDYNSKEFQEIVSQLDMQGHANDELSTCSVKQMYYEEVAEMLTDGMTVEEVLQFYVDEYGQAALREPATDKSGLIAWGMPIVGLAAGILVISLWLKKIKRRVPVDSNAEIVEWESETEKEIAAKIFEEERRKHF